MDKRTVTNPHAYQAVKVDSDPGYLMVCLCDEYTDGLTYGKVLPGAQGCSNHTAVKLESLLKLGYGCLLFVERDGDIVPLRVNKQI